MHKNENSLSSFGTEYDLIYQIVLLNDNFEKWKLQKKIILMYMLM